MPEDAYEPYVKMDFDEIAIEDNMLLSQFDRNISLILSKMEIDLGLCIQ